MFSFSIPYFHNLFYMIFIWTCVYSRVYVSKTNIVIAIRKCRYAKGWTDKLTGGRTDAQTPRRTGNTQRLMKVHRNMSEIYHFVQQVTNGSNVCMWHHMHTHTHTCTHSLGQSICLLLSISQDMYAKYLHMWLKFKCHTMSIKRKSFL